MSGDVRSILNGAVKMKTVRWMPPVAFLLALLAGCRLFTDTATLVVENRSEYAIDLVQIAPPGTPWGDDPLSDPIPPGDSRAFRSLTPGTYDILVSDTDEGWDAWLGEVLKPWERHAITYLR
jgi:hypothetical protein